MYPQRRPSSLFRPSRTVYKSTFIRLDGIEQGAKSYDSAFSERCCFGDTTKQLFISAKISYDIFFTDDIKLIDSSLPVTIFTEDEIESFLNYLKNVVDFEFAVEYGKSKDFDLYKSDDNFAEYLNSICRSCEMDYDELTGFLLHVTIDAIRPIHAFILQWIRQIYDGRAQFYTDIVYELKKRAKFKNMSLFTIMSLVYRSLRYSEGSSDMCAFPSNMYEGRLPFSKMRDKFDDMNKMFKRFADTNIYSNQLSTHKKKVPTDLEEYVNGNYLDFIDMFWCNLCRDLFVEDLYVYIHDHDKVSVFGDYSKMDDFVNHYDEIVKSFAKTMALILSKKWRLEESSCNYRNDTIELINSIYKYVSK